MALALKWNDRNKMLLFFYLCYRLMYQVFSADIRQLGLRFCGLSTTIFLLAFFKPWISHAALVWGFPEPFVIDLDHIQDYGEGYRQLLGDSPLLLWLVLLFIPDFSHAGIQVFFMTAVLFWIALQVETILVLGLWILDKRDLSGYGNNLVTQYFGLRKEYLRAPVQKSALSVLGDAFIKSGKALYLLFKDLFFTITGQPNEEPFSRIPKPPSLDGDETPEEPLKRRKKK